MPKKATISTGKEAAPKPSARKSPVRTAEIETEVSLDQVPEAAFPAPAERGNTSPKVIPVAELKTFDVHDYVTVRNGFNGKLIYKSKRTGERFVWDEFGSEQDMELQELKNAKNSSREFFEQNWFMLDDPSVISYLGVERYYKNSLNYEDFDVLFSMNPEEIERRIEKLPSGQRTSVIYLAREKIAGGEIDSMRVINALEKSLGVELIER